MIKDSIITFLWSISPFGEAKVGIPYGIFQDLNTVLPKLITRRLQKAFVAFGKKMKGYYSNQAVLHAPESRTSSPVLIPRHKDTLEHIDIKGLYPCAEGAGYAGGIISAAIDGINCVDAIIEKLKVS